MTKKITNLGQSVQDKLRNYAKKNMKVIHLVYYGYVFEKFLYRVYLSKYYPNLILKGGLLLHSVNLDIRQTTDIDLLIINISRRKTVIKSILSEICNISNDDALIFHTDDITIEEIMVKDSYGGYRIKIPVSLSRMKIILQIDIGFNDVIYPHAITISYPTLIDNGSSFTIKGYTIESFIAEKIHSIYDLGFTSSRMKDYYDLFMLSGKIEFKQIVVLKAIKKTFERRKTQVNSSRLLTVLNSNSLEDMFSNYITKEIRTKKISFRTVTTRLSHFFHPIFVLIENGTVKYKKIWNCKKDIWE